MRDPDDWTEADHAEFAADIARMKRHDQEEYEAMVADYHRRQHEQAAAEEQLVARQAKRDQAFADRRKDQARFDTPFLPTSVAAIVQSVIRRCITIARGGVIIGSPGVGKTYALREAVRLSNLGQGPEVALITITGTSGGSLRELWREVGPALGVPHIDENAAMRRRIIKHINRYPVLIFDEAQNLGLKHMRELLEVSSATGVQMIFCGNAEVLRRGTTSAETLRQISRRVPIREDIDCNVPADAEMIAAWFGVEGIEAYALCVEIGDVFHADGVATVLAVARDLGGTSNCIRLAAIKDALAFTPHIAAALEAAKRPKVPRRQSTLGPA